MTDIRAGQIRTFEENLPSLLKWAEFLIKTDEIEKAEWLLHHGMPGFYREFPPAEVIDMRKRMYQFLMNTSDYAMNREDNASCSVEEGIDRVNRLMRGTIIRDEVKAYNDKGIKPHVFEMGPGEYWLPIGLKGLGLDFTYQCSYLSQTAYDKSKQVFLDKTVDHIPLGVPQIFVACEIIEHLRSEKEISHCMHKHGLTPDQIHLSTPLYTFGQGCDGHWDSESNRGRGGHLRTYTPHEFISVAAGIFQGYIWSYHHHEVQSLIGRRG